MANAIKTEAVTEVVTPAGVTLELTEQEATDLMALLSVVNTDSKVNTFPIFDALYKAKVSFSRPTVQVTAPYPSEFKDKVYGEADTDFLLLVGGNRHRG